MPWQFRRTAPLLQLAALTVALGHSSCAASPLIAGRNATENGSASLHTIHVAYASDLALSKSLLAGMLSVARNMKDPANGVIHLIVPPLKTEAAARLAACFSRELGRLERTAPQVQVHELKNHQIDINGRFLQSEHAMGVLRLFLHEYLPGVPRVIWLDTDTIVTTDLAALYRHPMEHPIAAVREGAPRSFRVLYPNQPWGSLQKDEKIVPNPDALVFNAGVLLFDLDKWKSAAVQRPIQEWAARFGNAGPQLLLNLVGQVSGNFTELDWRWNVFGLGGLFPPRLEQAQQALVLHWSGANKPWTRPLNTRKMAVVEGALHKAGVRLPNMGHEKFDFLLMPYMTSGNCGEPAYVPM
uniref:Hexosyltransferase n=1 Tax=Alexandrium catenella TaxID=2925 RepID=A0A7S1RZ03_ALECA